MSGTVGSQSDILARLKAVLPSGWFPTTRPGQPSNSPVLDAFLTGPAYALSWIYSLIEYAQDQTRIATATDVWLDLAALDYFGGNLTRNSGETDTALSARIRANLLPPQITRAAMVSALTNLTGTAPSIFEPFTPADTGAYGTGEAPVWRGLAYNYAGGYGSLQLPAQCFITAYRTLDAGVPLQAGYNGNHTSPIYAPGGYGAGLIGYTTLAQAGEGVQDAEIYATVAATQAAGCDVLDAHRKPTR